MPTSDGSQTLENVNVRKEKEEKNMPNINENNDNNNTYKAALDARRERLAAMPEAMINRRLRLDVSFVCTAASTAVRAAGALREAMVAQFPGLAEQTLDGLDTSAWAARQAELEHQGQEENGEIAALYGELVTMHERLVADADSLGIRGYLSRERLATFRDARSHQGALNGVVGIVGVLRETWSAIAAHTPITAADLARADALAKRFDAALASRAQAGSRATMETRLRALSVLVYEYEDLRRMVMFLRHHQGDADRFVPSLYAGRGGRKPKGSEDVDVDDDDTFVPPVTGPVPVHGGPAFPINGGPAFPNT